MPTATDINPFGTLGTLDAPNGSLHLYRLQPLADAGIADLQRLPYSIRVLLENVLRQTDGRVVTEDDVRRLASWRATETTRGEIPFMPARVLLQDFTGVPAVVDLAAM